MGVISKFVGPKSAYASYKGQKYWVQTGKVNYFKGKNYREMRLGDQRWTSEKDEKLLKAGSLYPTLNGFDCEKLLAMKVELQLNAGIESFG